MEYLLDTDTCVDLLRGVPAVIGTLKTLAPDDCAVSAVTSFELFAGAARARDPKSEMAKVQKLLDVIPAVAFEAQSARRAGILRSELETAGTPVGPYDLLIAAHALSLNLVLVSANSREFGRIPDLRLECWR